MLLELKKEVLRISRMAEESGLCHHGGGNFSMMDREKNLVAITPHAESRFVLGDEDIIIIDMEGNVVESMGGYTPSSETVMHLEILKKRPDASAVCHTHAPRASAFSVLNKEIKPVLCESLMYGGICRVAPFQVPGTIELARAALEGLSGTSAVILQKHGLLTVGATVYDAYLKSMYVEEVGEAMLRAAAIVGYDNVEHIPCDQLYYLMNELGIVG